MENGELKMRKFYALLVLLCLLFAHNASAGSPPAYTSEAVVLMDAETGLILYGTNEHQELYPASITKIMTALVVLEQVYDLNTRIEFSHDAVFSIPRNSSHIYMDVGETLTVYDALMALMLPSANEVANALAEHVAGSVDEFARLMTRRAHALGAANTVFKNPSGLPASGHVTTAFDMALIKREAVRHPVFVDIIGTQYSRIPPTERQPLSRPLRNTNLLIHPGPHFNNLVIGGKTGWTNAAGHTLVTYAYDGERRLIVSVLRGEGRATFSDTTALLNYGFALEFEPVTVFDPDSYELTVPVFQHVNGERTQVGTARLRAERELTLELPPGHCPTWIRHELDVPEYLQAPVLMGAEIGDGLAVYVQNKRVGRVPLVSQDTILSYRPVAEASTANYGGGGDYLYSMYLSATSAAPLPLDFLSHELLMTFIIPIGMSLFTLFIALIGCLIARRRRRKQTADYVRHIRPEYMYREF
jgi:D-alanyl-D-alanine carboxypeptidase